MSLVEVCASCLISHSLMCNICSRGYIFMNLKSVLCGYEIHITRMSVSYSRCSLSEISIYINIYIFFIGLQRSIGQQKV